MNAREDAVWVVDTITQLQAENERLKAALRDAHALIDNDLVVPWIIAHKLDDVLRDEQDAADER